MLPAFIAIATDGHHYTIDSRVYIRPPTWVWGTTDQTKGALSKIYSPGMAVVVLIKNLRGARDCGLRTGCI